MLSKLHWWQSKQIVIIKGYLLILIIHLIDKIKQNAYKHKNWYAKLVFYFYPKRTDLGIEEKVKKIKMFLLWISNSTR